MSDYTQQQTSEELRQARELSLKRVRPPVEVPGYEAQRLLGRGAYGEVWVGVDLNTGRRVAIKFFAHRSGVDWTLLSREVEKLVYLSADRYVVQLLDVGWDAEPPYYVMEFIESGSLDDLLAERGPLPVREATELFTEIAIGLMHAHGKGVLHCDLKPANILLDVDRKPRLADFGQSRLSHEQSPSLGTLFYMAPEQADLNAIPDARWDVYALGAILHCMLVGAPPFRSPANIHQIETASDLEQRLDRYQEVIRSSPPPTDHRKVPGVDRALCEIIDRCLAVDPEQRLANVQEVFDSLQARSVAKARRPLILLGFVGPVLLIIIMALFGLRGYEDALHQSEEFITQRARQSNEFAAKFAARSIEGEISRYFRVARLEAGDEELQRRLLPVAESDLVRQLNQPEMSAKQVQALRATFIEDTHRAALNDYLQARLTSYLGRVHRDARQLKLASIFVVDRDGRMLAVAYDEPDTVTRSLGWNYSYRTYFHGKPADLSESHIDWQNSGPHDVSPIPDTHLSAAFQSTTTGVWKIAVSTPIYRENDPRQDVVGVLALTVNLGDFAYFRTNSRPDHFAVLIDGRPGANQGVVLQHPMLDRLARMGGLRNRFHVRSEQLARIQSDADFRYQDPCAQAPGGEAYAGDWITAMEWVRLPNGAEDKEEMLVLVQEKYVDAIKPVRTLGGQLKREGTWAFLGVASVVVVLWYVVTRSLNEPHLAPRRAFTPTSTLTQTRELTTLPRPSRK